MAEQDIDISADTSAPPAAVWRLLGDSATWPAWTSIDAHDTERAADADTNEIRVFTTGRVKVREEIVERVPEERLTYALLSGLPVRDYRAQIDLTPTPEGTHIRWHTTFRPSIPGTGWALRTGLRKATQQFVDGLVAKAEGGEGAP